MGAWAYLEGICRWPHRAPTSPFEREAAAWLASVLGGLGLSVRLQGFRSPAATLYAGPGVCGGLVGVWALAAATGAVHPGLAAAVSAAALVPLLGEVLMRRPNLDSVLPRRPSQNVMADLLPAGPGGPQAGAGRPEIVISAHYDTQRGSWLFAPRMGRWLAAYFRLAYATLAVAALSLVAGAVGAAAFPDWQGWRPAAAAGGAAALAAVGFLGVAGLAGRPVQGANDNGSGVAVALALAERFARRPPQGVRLRWVFTGAEEAGTRGMAAFMDAEYPGRSGGRAGVCFVNLDNVGGGRLRALLREGMVQPLPCGPTLRAVAQEQVRSGGGNFTLWPRMLLLPTDAAVPARRGYEALTWIGLEEDGSIPNYHWYTDTIERLDPQHLEAVVQTVAGFVEALARRLSEPARGAEGERTSS